MMEILDTQTLYTKRSKSFSLLVISTVFTLIGMAMILDDEPLAWFVTLFFGLGTILAALNLLPNSSYLKLSPDGFTVRSMFWSSSYRWHQIGHFSVRKVPGARIVVFDLTDKNRGSSDFRKLLASLSGHEGAIPDAYDLSLEDLAELMNEYRQRYTPVKPSRPPHLPDHKEQAEIDLATSVRSKRI